MTVFVDTSYFIAIANRRDQWHNRAMAAANAGENYITSSLVINETISLLQARRAQGAALQFLIQIRANRSVQIVYPDPVLQTLGWDQFQRWGGIGANAVDCVSFAIMERMAIRRVLTFDVHFEVAGFETLVGTRGA